MEVISSPSGRGRNGVVDINLCDEAMFANRENGCFSLADRLLRVPRRLGLRGMCTTRAGTLLKQHIPIRTFQQWNETQPGFLEADLVAHCGADIEGGYLYTLTLTDVATGWTECPPLLYWSQEAVLAALQRARTLFPFPILGIDSDNGGEFINDTVIAYCEQEKITFTRG